MIGGDLAVDDAFAPRRTGAGRLARARRAAARERPPATIPPPRAQVVIVDKPDAGRTALLRRPGQHRAPLARLLPGAGRQRRAVGLQRPAQPGDPGQARALVRRRRVDHPAPPAGLFLASTLVDHARAAEATEVTLETIRLAGRAPGRATTSWRPRKATLTGGFYRGIETIDGIVGALAELVLYDAPLSDLDAFVPRVEAVDAEAVRAFAARGLVPDDFVVLVGDAAKFAAGVARGARRRDRDRRRRARLGLAEPGSMSVRRRCRPRSRRAPGRARPLRPRRARRDPRRSLHRARRRGGRRRAGGAAVRLRAGRRRAGAARLGPGRRAERDRRRRAGLRHRHPPRRAGRGPQRLPVVDELPHRGGPRPGPRGHRAGREDPPARRLVRPPDPRPPRPRCAA